MGAIVSDSAAPGPAFPANRGCRCRLGGRVSGPAVGATLGRCAITLRSASGHACPSPANAGSRGGFRPFPGPWLPCCRRVPRPSRERGRDRVPNPPRAAGHSMTILHLHWPETCVCLSAPAPQDAGGAGGRDCTVPGFAGGAAHLCVHGSGRWAFSQRNRGLIEVLAAGRRVVASLWTPSGSCPILFSVGGTPHQPRPRIEAASFNIRRASNHVNTQECTDGVLCDRACDRTRCVRWQQHDGAGSGSGSGEDGR